jgi:hypothetical protein
MAVMPYCIRLLTRVPSNVGLMTAERRQDQRLNGAELAPRRRDVCAADRECPPHTWGCPVVMKVDPRSVAWTCASCGAIVTVPVGAPRPQASANPAG